MVRLRFFIITVLLCLRAVNAGAQVDVNTWNRYNNQGLRDILVEFNIQNGWHIFAPYAQEFGSPLEIKLKSDSPIEVLETSFSRPQTFNMEGFVYDGYKDKAFYKTTLKTDGIWRNIEANISWQACAGDECLPQEINLVIVPQETTEFEQKMQEAENFFLLDKTDTDYSWIALIFMDCIDFYGLYCRNYLKFDALCIAGFRTESYSLFESKGKIQISRSFFLLLGGCCFNVGRGFNFANIAILLSLSGLGVSDAKSLVYRGDVGCIRNINSIGF